LTITSNLHLSRRFEREELVEHYHRHYDGEPMVRVQEEAPWVSAIAGKHHVDIGGFSVSEDGRRVVVVSTLDNLLKGAATQALQNLNLAFGFDELTGIEVERRPRP
jgi:N-acetyl-gamma-glutamylphosphate reductase